MLLRVKTELVLIINENIKLLIQIIWKITLILKVENFIVMDFDMGG